MKNRTTTTLAGNLSFKAPRALLRFVMLFAFMTIGFAATAQRSATETADCLKSVKADAINRTNILSKSTELQALVQEKFGKSFDISSYKVVSFLLNTTYNENLDHKVRASAVKVLYGKIPEGYVLKTEKQKTLSK